MIKLLALLLLLLLLLVQVISTPNVGLELRTLRSRVSALYGEPARCP